MIDGRAQSLAHTYFSQKDIIDRQSHDEFDPCHVPPWTSVGDLGRSFLGSSLVSMAIRQRRLDVKISPMS